MAQKIEDLIGDAVYDPDGDKIGKVKRVYVNNSSGAPTWAAVSTGLFSEDSLVPLAGAQLRDDSDELRVRVDKESVKSAPHLEGQGLISEEAEEELFVHYGIDPDRRGWADYGRHTAGRTAHTADTSMDEPARAAGTAESRGDRSDFMVRSEEHLNVGTESEELGRARLRKYVVTEEQSVTVPTTHEQVHIEREPITDPSTARADFSDQEQEVVLHGERVTVEKESVPVERVRLAVDEVEEDTTVSETVRKERIDSEGIEREEGGRSR